MNFVVDPDKILKYLLNLQHRTGASKAKFFLARGFSTDRPDEMIAALTRHPLEAVLKGTNPDPEGRKLVYECFIRFPDRSTTCIRTVWMEAADTSYTRLISAYPF
jgi:hypothetical protein